MTDFRQDKAIYVQIAESICDDILSGHFGEDDRIPSVRELSVLLEVNTNTVVRTYDILTREGIIYTRRGMGFFVSPGARDRIIGARRARFMKEQLPDLFRQMKLLGIGIETVDRLWHESVSGSI